MAPSCQLIDRLRPPDWGFFLYYIPAVPWRALIVWYWYGRHLGPCSCDCARKCAGRNTGFPLGSIAGRLCSWIPTCRRVLFLFCHLDLYQSTAVVNLTVVQHSSHSWRTLFWVSAGISFFAACFRAVLPESEVFLRARAARKQIEQKGVTASSKTRVFFHETKVMLKEHWMLCIYAILLMTGASLLHGCSSCHESFS